MAPHGGLLSRSRDKNVKERISLAIREVELQRKEVEQIRIRLDERRKTIFDSIVKAFEHQDEKRARVFSNEHVELQKVSKVVNASELALLHIVVRLETLRDVGDVMYALSNAFKDVKRIGKSIENLAPNLEIAANQINDSFTNILAELGALTPNVSIALSDTPQEIFAKAQALIKERTSELGELPRTMAELESSKGTSILEQTKRIALLASGEDAESGEEDDEEQFKPTILVGDSEAAEEDPDRALRNYIHERGTDKIDVFACSAHLNLPVDLVEQAYIKLLSERRSARSSNPN